MDEIGLKYLKEAIQLYWQAIDLIRPDDMNQAYHMIEQLSNVVGTDLSSCLQQLQKYPGVVQLIERRPWGPDVGGLSPSTWTMWSSVREVYGARLEIE